MHAAAVLSDLRDFKDGDYFRRRAERTRELSRTILQPDVRWTMLNLARDYDELADDLEQGTAGIRHPELLPRRGS
jgi:hypothetical protein